MSKKGDVTRHHIQQEAFLLFSKKGYTAVSMQDVCTACGLSKGGLYRYFESKEQLFLELLQAMQSSERQQEQMQIIEGEPAPVILKSLLEHTRTELFEKIPTVNFALYEFCMEQKNEIGSEFLKKQFQRGTEILAQLITYGNNRGEFKTEEPQAAAESILLLLEGLKLFHETAHLSRERMEDVFRQVWKLVGRDSYEKK